MVRRPEISPEAVIIPLSASGLLRRGTIAPKTTKRSRAPRRQGPTTVQARVPAIPESVVVEERRVDRRSQFPQEAGCLPNLSVRTFLEQQAVGSATRVDYHKRAARFDRWCLLSQHKVATQAQMEAALLTMFHEMFFEGADAAEGWKTLAALYHCRLDLAPRFANVPRVIRALKGWSRLAPARSRLPLPWLMTMLVINSMMKLRFHTSALATALCFALYLRPSEALSLRREQLIPPVRLARRAEKKWSVVLHPFEGGRPSKTKAFDESLTAESTAFPWLPKMMTHLRSQTQPLHSVFPLQYSLWSKQFAMAWKEAGLASQGSATLYQLRHGGASHELLTGARSAADLKKRGRWVTDSSMSRYAKSARIHEQLQKLPAPLLAKAVRVEKVIGGLLCGTSRPL